MKKELIESLIKKLEQRALKLEGSVNDLQNAVLNSPPATESWSDNTRFESREVIFQLVPKISKIKKCIEFLKEINTNQEFKKVKLGSLVQVKNNYYFIVPETAGGETIKAEKNQAITLSIKSPLAKELENKKTGDKVTIGESEKTISQIL